VPPGVSTNAMVQGDLGSYSAGLLPSLLSMTNWASNIATGGNTQQAAPYDVSGTGMQGPLGFNTQTGLALTNEGGGDFRGFTGGDQATTVSAGGGQSSQAPGSTTSGTGTASGGTMAQVLQAYQKMFGTTPPGLNDGTIAFDQSQTTPLDPYQLQGTLPTPSGGTITLGQLLSGGGATGMVASPGMKLDSSASGTQAAGTPTSTSSLLGPFLSEAWNSILGMSGLQQNTADFTKTAEAQSGQLYNEGQNLLTSGGNLLTQGGNMVNQATTGSGLYPSQQAYVDQAVTSGQTSVDSQLAAEGLGSSTSDVMLKNQVAEAGAATAGQLLQGNISAGQAEQQIGISEQQTAQQQINLAQAAQKIALGGQELSLAEQTALEQEASGLQQQMWTQAMQGYGVLGQMIQTSLQAFGYSSQSLSQYTQASETNAQVAASLQAAQEQAANQSSSSLGAGLGSLFGGGSGGSGGLLGSLGSLFGGIGGTVAGAGAVGGGALAGSGIGAIAGAVLAA
jgi:hypothetical protein